MSVRKRETTPPTSSVTTQTIAAVFSLKTKGDGKFDAIGGADNDDAGDGDIRDWLGAAIVTAGDESCHPVEISSSGEVEMMSTR